MNALELYNVKLADGGTPLLFSHSDGCDRNEWPDVAPDFAGGCRVVLMDHAECGMSAPGSYSPVRHASLKAHADNIPGIFTFGQDCARVPIARKKPHRDVSSAARPAR